MDIANMTMIPGDTQAGEKSRYYVWLPEGRDIGAPFREFDPVPLDHGVLKRLKQPADVYLCYEEEDRERIPQVGTLREGVNVYREADSQVRIDVEAAEMHYRGSDMEGANWLLLVWK